MAIRCLLLVACCSREREKSLSSTRSILVPFSLWEEGRGEGVEIRDTNNEIRDMPSVARRILILHSLRVLCGEIR